MSCALSYFSLNSIILTEMIFYKQLGDRDKNGAVADFFIFEKTVVFP